MKKALALTFLCLSVWVGAAQAQLKIDFTEVADGAAGVEPGYQGYFATRSQPATFTAQSYSAFGATVTVQPTWVPNAAATAQAMIDRGVTNVPEAPGLLRDWIGTDIRNNLVGDPMTLVIRGLPAGAYQWLSYHHDRNDQTGVFDVTLNDAAGSKTTTGIDISNGTNFRLADVTQFTTTIVSNGRSDVRLAFDVTSTGGAQGFFVMNGFELTAIEIDEAIALAPANGAVDVRRDGTILSWLPSKKAVAHGVYLGTDHDAIDDGMTTSAVYLGRQDANSLDLGRLELGTTYYWRVDEIAADNQVTKGAVWRFTVEPVSVPLAGERITATASSENSVDEGPGKTVDGSGLTDNRHSTTTTDMWLTGVVDSGPVWIQYEFDRTYKLHQMLVWNHNSSLESSVGFGVKDATIEYSTDGLDWDTLGTTHEIAPAPGNAGYAGNAPIDMGGVAAKYIKLNVLSNWKGALKQYGLSEVRFLVIPVVAREPQPASGATAVDPRAGLSWRAGRDADVHKVYLSTDVNEVRGGTALVGTVSEPRLEADGLLELGRTYSWRVDEANDLEQPPVWEGEVWSFSTVASLVVDDFESYNDDVEAQTTIYDTWLDGVVNGTGSTVGYWDPPFAEPTIVHGGGQSMPFQYDSSTAATAEGTRTFDDPQDWTRYGAKALTLWFCGDPANEAAQMYLKINGHKVPYNGEADNLLRRPWQLWYVGLEGLAGVDLRQVTELTLGFEGGQGRVFFDDLALSPDDRRLVTPVEPDPAGLVAHYAFDGDTSDSTGGPAGAVGGAPTFVPGKVGQAIKLNGATDYVLVTRSLDLPSYSAALWFKVEGGTGNRDLVSIFNDTAQHGALLEVNSTGGLRFLHRAPVGPSAGDVNIRISNTGRFDDGAWYHAAMVQSADRMTLYVNGVQAGSAASTAQFGQALTQLALGMLKFPIVSTDARYFPGQMDEVYLYSRALSAAEVAWLAGRTTPFDQ